MVSNRRSKGAHNGVIIIPNPPLCKYRIFRLTAEYDKKTDWTIIMEKIIPPKYIIHILKTLRMRGHSAYLVGGCVRDILLGVRPQDWDICTSALPEQVLDIFPGSVPTGLKHGTVTVKVNSRRAEVTTFRTEDHYTDHRHPDSVRFVSDLRSDLSRRDFTMNAIALSANGIILDPFGGAEDIEHKRIRCVGEPERRFEEDALRMFRALRFAARLGFDIEPGTMRAIYLKAPLALELAPERVRDELEKILLSPSPETVFDLMAAGLLEGHARRPLSDKEPFIALGRLPKKALNRWAGLCALLLSLGSIRSAEEFLSNLRLDSRTVRCCATAAELLAAPLPSSPAEWKRLLSRHGLEPVSCAAHCADAARGGKQNGKALKAVLKSGDCFSMKHLAVTGDDLLDLGLEGRALGEMLSFLLDYVIDHPENNRRELLLALAGGVEE